MAGKRGFASWVMQLCFSHPAVSVRMWVVVSVWRCGQLCWWIHYVMDEQEPALNHWLSVKWVELRSVTNCASEVRFSLATSCFVVRSTHGEWCHSVSVAWDVKLWLRLLLDSTYNDDVNFFFVVKIGPNAEKSELEAFREKWKWGGAFQCADWGKNSYICVYYYH